MIHPRRALALKARRDRGAALVAVFQDPQHVVAGDSIQRLQAAVIEDEHVRRGQAPYDTARRQQPRLIASSTRKLFVITDAA